MTLNHRLWKEIRTTFTKWRGVRGCGESALRGWVGHALIPVSAGPFPPGPHARRSGSAAPCPGRYARGRTPGAGPEVGAGRRRPSASASRPGSRRPAQAEARALPRHTDPARWDGSGLGPASRSPRIEFSPRPPTRHDSRRPTDEAAGPPGAGCFIVLRARDHDEGRPTGRMDGGRGRRRPICRAGSTRRSRRPGAVTRSRAASRGVRGRGRAKSSRPPESRHRHPPFVLDARPGGRPEAAWPADRGRGLPRGGSGPPPASHPPPSSTSGDSCDSAEGREGAPVPARRRDGMCDGRKPPGPGHGRPRSLGIPDAGWGGDGGPPPSAHPRQGSRGSNACTGRDGSRGSRRPRTPADPRPSIDPPRDLAPASNTSMIGFSSNGGVSSRCGTQFGGRLKGVGRSHYIRVVAVREILILPA